MKLVVAVVRPEKLSDVLESLFRAQGRIGEAKPEKGGCER